MKDQYLDLFPEEVPIHSGEHQGASRITEIKEAQIYGVVKTRLLQRKHASWIDRMHVYDVFCGDGINVVEGEAIWGSPVEIERAIKDSGLYTAMPVVFKASDIRQESVEVLKNRLKNSHLFGVFCEHGQASDKIAELKHILNVNHDDHAIVVIDPNGPGVLPYSELLDVVKRHSRRVDVFINISETAMNRVLKCSVTKNKNWWKEFNDFSEVVMSIFSYYKEGWLRDVVPGDKQRWRFMCFWNYAPPKNDWRKQGLLKIQDIYDVNEMLKKGYAHD